MIFVEIFDCCGRLNRVFSGQPHRVFLSTRTPWYCGTGNQGQALERHNHTPHHKKSITSNYYWQSKEACWQARKFSQRKGLTLNETSTINGKMQQSRAHISLISFETESCNSRMPCHEKALDQLAFPENYLAKFVQALLDLCWSCCCFKNNKILHSKRWTKFFTSSFKTVNLMAEASRHSLNRLRYLADWTVGFLSHAEGLACAHSK